MASSGPGDAEHCRWNQKSNPGRAEPNLCCLHIFGPQAGLQIFSGQAAVSFSFLFWDAAPPELKGLETWNAANLPGKPALNISSSEQAESLTPGLWWFSAGFSCSRIAELSVQLCCHSPRGSEGTLQLSAPLGLSRARLAGWGRANSLVFLGVHSLLDRRAGQGAGK